MTLALVPAGWSADSFHGTCIKAPAADRLEVWRGRDDGIVTVCLAGIDPGSLRDGYGHYAAAFTRERAVGKAVTVEVHERHGGGAVTGRVIVEHHDLSYLLIAEGLARASHAAPSSLRLGIAEDSARRLGRGLWADAGRVETGRGTPGNLSDLAWQLDRNRALAPWLGDGIEISLGSWLEMHESAVIAGWGPPSYIEPAGRGGSVLVYDRCSGPTSAAVDRCRELLYVDRDGWVYRREVDGG